MLIMNRNHNSILDPNNERRAWMKYTDLDGRTNTYSPAHISQFRSQKCARLIGIIRRGRTDEREYVKKSKMTWNQYRNIT